ncbi:Orm1 type endoplasmic reticulum protein [Rhizoctonia solani]|uniref:Orm1 type endoplasmic reticulum protein n=1 Tax=Rhizoctonia solani TaxID=456999 RepID=A0A8H7HAK5_9AGAM|nr:Orm1 type endoplasmic reticulum protein [Rhizoctonia solani]
MSSPRASVPPPISIASKSDGGAKGRARSSSIVAVQEVGGNGAEEMLDQSVYINRNSEWVNGKGAWIIHPMLTLAAKVLIDVLPGVSQEASWTIVNLGYLLVGIPFDPDLHGGAYDDLTMWEQIDQGAQYTPAKKWLFTMPIALPTIGPNSETSAGLHRQRVRFLVDDPTPSGAATPMTPMTPSVSGTNTPTYRRSWAEPSN